MKRYVLGLLLVGLVSCGENQQLGNQPIQENQFSFVKEFNTADDMLAHLADQGIRITPQLKESVHATYDAIAKFGSVDEGQKLYDSSTETQKLELRNMYPGAFFDRIPQNQTDDSQTLGNGNLAAQAIPATTTNPRECARRIIGPGAYTIDRDLNGFNYVTNPITYDYDSAGRALGTVIKIIPRTIIQRDTTCQSEMGLIGDNEKGVVKKPNSANTYETYDGGHLVPNAIGGWSRTLNLTPQISNLNREVMSTIDTVLKNCMNKVPNKMEYIINAVYSGNSSVPTTFRMSILSAAFPAPKVLNWNVSNISAYQYVNINDGVLSGSHTMAQSAAQVRAWLVSEGCAY